LQRAHPQIEMIGLGTDFSRSLRLPAEAGDGPRTVFFPGSSIGNFSPAAACELLRSIRAAAPGGCLLIGVDLVKPRDVLEQAYDDALGVTAAFNLNLLRHANRLIGTDFDVRQWRHLARFDAARGCVQMHLAAREDVRVCWPDGQREFPAGARIHTEDSYKYRRDDFAALLRDAGFRQLRCWTDDDEWFAVFVARG
jgi:dimethylhistidine N-methyltransferase